MNSIDFYAKFIGEEARKLKSSTIFSEQEVMRAQPVKAKPVSNQQDKAEPVKAEPANSQLDSELEDEPTINPKEQGAKFQPMVKSPEYMDDLIQNQDKIIAAKRAREEAGPYKSKIQASSASVDKEAI